MEGNWSEYWTTGKDRQMVLWCSGYHVCFTRRRSWVRTSSEPHSFSRTVDRYHYGSDKNIQYSIIFIRIFHLFKFTFHHKIMEIYIQIYSWIKKDIQDFLNHAKQLIFCPQFTQNIFIVTVHNFHCKSQIKTW